MVTKAPLPLEQRQRYRLKDSYDPDGFVARPDWFRTDAIYEGDIDPSSQDCPELKIRLFNPTDGELTFLVDEACLDEID